MSKQAVWSRIRSNLTRLSGFLPTKIVRLVFLIALFIMVTSLLLMQDNRNETDLVIRNIAIKHPQLVRNHETLKRRNTHNHTNKTIKNGLLTSNTNSLLKVDRYEINERHLGKDIYDIRRRHMLTQCLKLPKIKKYNRVWYSIDKRHESLFCAIPKVASSFFRLLLGMTRNNKKRFTKDVIYKSINTPFINENTENLKKMFPGYKTAIFVRDPWWRLYSSYINKIYMPQTQYWENFGKQAIRVGRKNPTYRSIKCGDDASFTEFVKLVIHLHKLFRQVDLHVVTFEERCDPCVMKYAMIGKLETYSKDVDHWAKYFNISSYMDADYSTVFRDYDVKKTATDVVDKFESHMRRCISIDDAIFRLWTYFKLRGRLDPDIPSPRVTDVTHNGTFVKDKFINTVMTAYKRSKSKQRRVYKQQAFEMAYQTISMEDKLKLIEIYKRDFLLFDYDSMPFEVFNSTVRNDDIPLFKLQTID